MPRAGALWRRTATPHSGAAATRGALCWRKICAAGSLVFTNPPYGERLGDAGTAAALERTLGQRLAACSVKGAYIITADADFEAHFGRKAQRRRKLYNGMIPCQVYMYY